MCAPAKQELAPWCAARSDAKRPPQPASAIASVKVALVQRAQQRTRQCFFVLAIDVRTYQRANLAQAVFSLAGGICRGLRFGGDANMDAVVLGIGRNDRICPANLLLQSLIYERFADADSLEGR